MASSLQMLKMYNDAIQFYSMASVMDPTDPADSTHRRMKILLHGTPCFQSLQEAGDQEMVGPAAFAERAEALQQMVKKKPSGRWTEAAGRPIQSVRRIRLVN